MYSALRSHTHKKAPRAMAFLKPVFKYLSKQNIYAIYVLCLEQLAKNNRKKNGKFKSRDNHYQLN